MVQSMTGYGKSECDICDKNFTVEIKSLNSKQLDLSLRIPTIFKDSEMEIRKLLQNKIPRGKVDFSIFYCNNETNNIQNINTETAKIYYKQILDISKNMSVNVDEKDILPMILRMPDIFKSENKETTQDDNKKLFNSIDEAIANFLQFRIQEGEMLKKIFIKNVSTIEKLLLDINQFETSRVETIKQRLLDFMKENQEVTIDKNRFEQELIYYIEKLDVNEEKNRLANHCKYFRETLQDNKPIGKKLGFIAQEMGREINTLGSKSNNSDMQKIVVCMKDELEQIKEQILNVM